MRSRKVLTYDTNTTGSDDRASISARSRSAHSLLPSFGLCCGIALSLLASPSAQADTTILDGDFSNFTTTAAIGTVTGVRVASGGDPGAYYQSDVVTHSFGENAIGANIKTNYTNTAALAGTTWSMQVNAEGGTGFPVQRSGLAVKQGSNIWWYDTDFIVNPSATSWGTFTQGGTFNASSFQLLDLAGGGPAHPVFTAGTASQFGFASQISGSIVADFQIKYDNWSLTGQSLDSEAATTPEPGVVALLGGLGVSGIGFAVRRRRKA